jgi:hypothetical protein
MWMMRGDIGGIKALLHSGVESTTYCYMWNWDMAPPGADVDNRSFTPAVFSCNLVQVLK